MYGSGIKACRLLTRASLSARQGQIPKSAGLTSPCMVKMEVTQQCPCSHAGKSRPSGSPCSLSVAPLQVPQVDQPAKRWMCCTSS